MSPQLPGQRTGEGAPARTGQTAAPTRRVVIVEDHTLLAQSMALALEAEGVEVVIPTLTALPDLIGAIACCRPGLVLLDLQLGPPVGDGTALVRPLVERGLNVLVVTSITDHSRLAVTLERGALGFVSKCASVEVLLAAVLRALRGEPVLDVSERRRLLSELHREQRLDHLRRQAYERLTPRERQVLEALAAGKTVSLIAREWVVAPSTVRTQVRGILTKLGVSCQLEAVALALSNGWLTQQPSPTATS